MDDFLYCGLCNDKYVPGNALQYLCNNCKPKCRGCKKQFDPVLKTEYLCTSCLSKANSMGTCAKCGDLSQLDEDATCSDCVSRSIPREFSTCVECLKVEMAKGDICLLCQSKEITCPSCMQEKINAKEYKCNTCRKKQEKLFS